MTTLARRNRAAVAAAVAVVAVLVAGVVVSTALYVRSEGHRARAEKQTEKAMASLGFIENLIWSADPTNVGNEVMFADLLMRYGKNIHEHFEGQAEVEATIRMSIAYTFFYLDLFEKAGQAENYKQAARDHLIAALDLRREALGEDHDLTLESMSALPDHYRSKSEHGAAEGIQREMLDIVTRTRGPESEESLSVMSSLASTLHKQGRGEEAESLIRRTLEIGRRNLGDEHEQTSSATNKLAWILEDQGRFLEAEPLHRQVLEYRQRMLGPDHRDTRTAMTGVAYSLVSQRRFDEAAALFEEVSVPVDYGAQEWYQGGGELGDEPTVVVYWATWCPFCIVAMPRLENFWTEYESSGLRIVGLTDQRAPEKVKRFLAERDISFPVAHWRARREGPLSYRTFRAPWF